jgi:hypothetical protein
MGLIKIKKVKYGNKDELKDVKEIFKKYYKENKNKKKIINIEDVSNFFETQFKDITLSKNDNKKLLKIEYKIIETNDIKKEKIKVDDKKYVFPKFLKEESESEDEDSSKESDEEEEVLPKFDNKWNDFNVTFSKKYRKLTLISNKVTTIVG